MSSKTSTSRKLAELRRRVVRVAQFPLFVADTVRSNFQLAKAQATDEEIEKVCRSGSHEQLMKCDNLYKRLVEAPRTVEAEAAAKSAAGDKKAPAGMIPEGMLGEAELEGLMAEGMMMSEASVDGGMMTKERKKHDDIERPAHAVGR